MKMRIIFLFVSNPASQMPKSVFVLNCLINTHLMAPGVFHAEFNAVFSMQTDENGCPEILCPYPRALSPKADRLPERQEMAARYASLDMTVVWIGAKISAKPRTSASSSAVCPAMQS